MRLCVVSSKGHKSQIIQARVMVLAISIFLQDRNQTTIKSPEWLNTKRTFFRTNSCPVYLGVRLPVLEKYSVCYTILKRALHRRSEKVKTVQVAGHFGKLWSTKSPLIEVLLHTGTVFKVAVPQNIKHYLLKELFNLYSKLDKNHGHAM